MAVLRVLSWNLRTFAAHRTDTWVQVEMTHIILQSEADIVCIQELQIGRDGADQIGKGEQASVDSINEVWNILSWLTLKDPAGDWNCQITPVSAPQGSKYMRDVYAFFWKQAPLASSHKHPGSPDKIECLAEPMYLEASNFPGRRPGMITLTVHAGSNIIPVNVISYHAPTPCNTKIVSTPSRTPIGTNRPSFAAGNGILALGKLPEIGGGTSNKAQVPLPVFDTVVLGDFNYSMDKPGAGEIYKNLLDNYQACISWPQSIARQARIIRTTYSPNPKTPGRLVSAYDNIFVLRGHGQFTPCLSFPENPSGASDAIDFLQEFARAYGVDNCGIKIDGDRENEGGKDDEEESEESIQYIFHSALYKSQWSKNGISDHLPVWADFTLAAAGATAGCIKPTCTSDSLLSAMFGRWDGKMYVEPDRLGRRAEIVNKLKEFKWDPPSHQNLWAALLASIWQYFSDSLPENVRVLKVLLQNTQKNPFTDAGGLGKKDADTFRSIFHNYLDGIGTGSYRFYDCEAELFALLCDIRLTLWRRGRGGFEKTDYNEAGTGDRVAIFSEAPHFFRWEPS